MNKRYLAFATTTVLVAGCSSLRSSRNPPGLPLRYENAQYGLKFFLPADWQGYSVAVQQWEGTTYVPAKDTTALVAKGSVIVLRHPRWKGSAPRQDVPIMVFTRSQWEDEVAGKFFPYAGGAIEELWHNDHYVFGLYSRYNWGELPGSQEATDILERNRAAHPMPRLHPY